MAKTEDNIVRVNVMSYNMRGFYQGCSALNDMITQYDPDVILLQEHWLTPAKLHLFDSHFVNYFSFGSSAMMKHVEVGMLRGRPFGGVIILIKNSLRKMTKTIHCSDRYAIIKVGNSLFVNVYLPCVGTTDRQLICDDVLAEIDAWLLSNCDCSVVMAGDFNANLDSTDSVVDNICAFTNSHNLLRCDDLFPSEKHPTYVNEPLNRESYIDYIFVSRECQVNKFSVIDPDINFSDHLPLLATVSYIASPAIDKTKFK